MFAYLPDLQRARRGPRRRASQELAAAGHPLITIPTPGPAIWPRVHARGAGRRGRRAGGCEINPFDQPNVQQAKDATKACARRVRGARRAAIEAAGRGCGAALRSLLARPRRRTYVAIMAYAEPSSEFDAAVAELRTAIRAAGGATTTFGYGPRFLHSTGQFHKGGPPDGPVPAAPARRAEDVDDPRCALHLPTLKNAQAIGDLQTLRELGLAGRARLEGETRRARCAI